MNDFVFINAKVVSSHEISECDVHVQGGKIKEVGKNLSKNTSKIIDLQGKYLLPGLIDVHVHFRTPGFTQKEDWVTGSKAALAGGVTSVIDMPNTSPSTIDEESLHIKRSMVEKEAMVNYAFFAGATKTNSEILKNMKGVAGVKVYMGSSTGNLLVDDLKVLEELMKNVHKIFAFHAESESCIQKGFKEHAGETDPAVHSKIRAPECATQAVEAVLVLVEKYLGRVHFCHTSTAKEIDLIRKFKKNNPSLAKLVSVEVTPHHLFLDDGDYLKFGNIVKVNPPLRSQQDVEALWQGIQDGTVDMVATDHAPHLFEEKQLSYDQVPSGVPGVQTMLPLMLQAVNDGRLSLTKVVELCSLNPAERFGLHGKGKIISGFDADFAVVDLDFESTVSEDYSWSKARWSPFEGRMLKGWPVMTFVNGQLMYEWRDKFGHTLAAPLAFD